MSQLAFVVIGVTLAAAAAMALYRIVRGPSILDRMIASDMLLTTIMCALGAEMVYHHHTRSLPVMLVIAATAILAAVVVARYVTRRGDPS
jgi:multicomponent Na+:H+ antiporter subunit F